MDAIPRAVDERDTRWERDVHNLRVFIQDAAHGRDVYDLDRVTLKEAMEWAETQVTEKTTNVWIALRTLNARGEPGLLMLIGEPPG